MSPNTARGLIKGDYIARRGPIIPNTFTHVAVVLKKTREAIYAMHPGAPARGVRYAFANNENMASIRRASQAEILGYEMTVG